MGVYQSQFQPASGQKSLDSTLSPDNPDWIVVHAMTTQLAVPEVERLWLRFRQLGYGPDFRNEFDTNEHDLFSDPFVRNIMKCMKDDNGEVSFQSFLLLMKWLETSGTDDKLRGIFHLLNNGKPLKQDSLMKVLKVIYPDANEAEISSSARMFMDQVDKGRKGSVREEEFMQCTRHLSSHDLEPLMTFTILPPEISQEAESRLSEFRSVPGAASRRSRDHVGSQLTDDVLLRVANGICRRDWSLVMNKLGFLERDVRQFQQSSSREKIYAMLKEWRRRDGRLADVTTLTTALTGSGIHDVL